jgi:hypothetical protein
MKVRLHILLAPMVDEEEVGKCDNIFPQNYPRLS